MTTDELLSEISDLREQLKIKEDDLAAQPDLFAANALLKYELNALKNEIADHEFKANAAYWEIDRLLRATHMAALWKRAAKKWKKDRDDQRALGKDCFNAWGETMTRADSLEKALAALKAELKKECTCDENCDDLCPVHFIENQLQDEKRLLMSEIEALRAKLYESYTLSDRHRSNLESAEAALAALKKDARWLCKRVRYIQPTGQVREMADRILEATKVEDEE